MSPRLRRGGYESQNGSHMILRIPMPAKRNIEAEVAKSRKEEREGT
jgi:hypothetical protein